MAELLPALSQRRALRAFTAAPVSAKTESLLWRAVALAPSHGNTQPARIVIARSPAVRAALIAALSEGNRQWAPAAPLLFALTTNPSHDALQMNTDGTSRELWAFHAGIATGNLLAQGTELGLIVHPMAGFDEPLVRSALGIPPEVRVIVVVAAGYPGQPDALPEDLRSRETLPQDRLPVEHIVAEDRWLEVLELSAREFRKQQPKP